MRAFTASNGITVYPYGDGHMIVGTALFTPEEVEAVRTHLAGDTPRSNTHKWVPGGIQMTIPPSLGLSGYTPFIGEKHIDALAEYFERKPDAFVSTNGSKFTVLDNGAVKLQLTPVDYEAQDGYIATTTLIMEPEELRAINEFLFSAPGREVLS